MRLNSYLFRTEYNSLNSYKKTRQNFQSKVQKLQLVLQNNICENKEILQGSFFDFLKVKSKRKGKIES